MFRSSQLDAILISVDVVLGQDLALLPGQRILGERAVLMLSKYSLHHHQKKGAQSCGCLPGCIN